MEAARIVTTITKTKFVFQHPKTSTLAGICVDLWRKIASELNLTYTVDIVDSWWQMHPHFAQNKSDVIMERMDDGQMELFNITK